MLAAPAGRFNCRLYPRKRHEPHFIRVEPQDGYISGPGIFQPDEIPGAHRMPLLLDARHHQSWPLDRACPIWSLAMTFGGESCVPFPPKERIGQFSIFLSRGPPAAPRATPLSISTGMSVFGTCRTFNNSCLAFIRLYWVFIPYGTDALHLGEGYTNQQVQMASKVQGARGAGALRNVSYPCFVRCGSAPEGR